MNENNIAVARRSSARRTAAMLLNGMAHSDMGIAQIAENIDCSELLIRQYFESLVEGDGNVSLDKLAEICCAMGLEADFNVRQIVPSTKVTQVPAGTEVQEHQTDGNE